LLVKAGTLTVIFPARKTRHFFRIYFLRDSHFGNRLPIKSVGRSTQGVKLLDLEPKDKVAATVVIPPKKPKPNPKLERSWSKPYFRALFSCAEERFTKCGLSPRALCDSIVAGKSQQDRVHKLPV
jgi:hypothetical protein